MSFEMVFEMVANRSLAGSANAFFTCATSASPMIERGSGSVAPEKPVNDLADLFGALPIVQVLSAL